jgi:hypothetical protein
MAARAVPPLATHRRRLLFRPRRCLFHPSRARALDAAGRPSASQPGIRVAERAARIFRTGGRARLALVQAPRRVATAPGQGPTARKRRRSPERRPPRGLRESLRERLPQPGDALLGRLLARRLVCFRKRSQQRPQVAGRARLHPASPSRHCGRSDQAPRGATDACLMADLCDGFVTPRRCFERALLSRPPGPRGAGARSFPAPADPPA